MAEPQEVVELTEDLTIQNVILESLLGAEFAGAEEERREATRQIERLNERLRSLRRSIQMHREGELLDISHSSAVRCVLTADS